VTPSVAAPGDTNLIERHWLQYFCRMFNPDLYGNVYVRTVLHIDHFL